MNDINIDDIKRGTNILCVDGEIYEVKEVQRGLIQSMSTIYVKGNKQIHINDVVKVVD